MHHHGAVVDLQPLYTVVSQMIAYTLSSNLTFHVNATVTQLACLPNLKQLTKVTLQIQVHRENNSGLLQHALGCLLITVKLHSRIRDNSCAVGAIAFEKTVDALTLPNWLQTLYSSTIFRVERVLNLWTTTMSWNRPTCWWDLYLGKLGVARLLPCLLCNWFSCSTCCKIDWSECQKVQETKK